MERVNISRPKLSLGGIALIVAALAIVAGSCVLWQWMYTESPTAWLKENWRDASIHAPAILTCMQCLRQTRKKLGPAGRFRIILSLAGKADGLGSQASKRWHDALSGSHRAGNEHGR